MYSHEYHFCAVCGAARPEVPTAHLDGHSDDEEGRIEEQRPKEGRQRHKIGRAKAGWAALPPGWAAAESRSHPGAVVYENVHTAERIAWTPVRPASEVEGMSPDLDPDNGLPEGWQAVESTSRPGEARHAFRGRSIFSHIGG